MEGTGEERRREAVNPTHGMFMFNICTHQTAGINPCRYRILCHSRSRKPILKHVFKDFQLRKTVMEFYERKHRQEPAPSLSCWEWVKFTTRLGEGVGATSRKWTSFILVTIRLRHSNPTTSLRPMGRSVHPRGATAQETLLFWRRVTPPLFFRSQQQYVSEPCALHNATAQKCNRT